jgi:hypothetical protein
MMSQFLLLLVLVTILSNVQSFVGRSNRVQTSTTFKHSALLMSKASQEKADEKKRKQAMVGHWRINSTHLQTYIWMFVPVNIDVYMYIYMHTYIYTFVNTRVHL